MDVKNIRLFNTLSREKEIFEPILANNVSVYQCGPTVYWTQHIGNMRAMVMADLLVRMFKYGGFEVTFVRNYTDVGHMTSDEDEGEDKMERGALREGKTPTEIAEKYIDIFEQDLATLNTFTPNHRPKATAYISEMIAFIEKLIKKDFAYVTPLAVYFDISKAKDYTRLSHQNLEKNIEDAGHGSVSDPLKKNSADFALWFFKAGVHEHALQAWKNPFSEKEGFPGWHIECSAMIRSLMGDTIDIHMGGIEHISIHHTNEIAQSEALTGKPLAHYWLHNEHLLVDGKKMSKSEGTSYSIEHIKEKNFDPLSLRYLFLNSHYKSKQNFTWEALQGAETSLHKLQHHIGEEIGTINQPYHSRFMELISDDLNIPQALALAWEVAKDTSLSFADKTATLLDFDRVFGLNLSYQAAEEVPEKIKALARKREDARKEKKWEESDKIRDEARTLGYEIADFPEGPKVTKI